MGSGQSKEYFDISFFFNTHEAKKNRQGKLGKLRYSFGAG
jgi:hypothetical protein